MKRTSRVQGPASGLKPGICGTLGGLEVLVLLTALATPAHPQAYTFTKVADSAEDGFSPFSFECSAINNRGDIAFRTARLPKRPGPLVQGIYRADAGERDGDEVNLTTIAEFDRGFDFLGRIPSINDLGEVTFAISRISEIDFVEIQRIMRGNGTKLTTIATTANEFNRFGFEPSINNANVVAFKADIDSFDISDNANGLFSGLMSEELTTHYLSSTSKFSEFSTLSRPSINKFGDIAFEESVDGQSTTGIFVTEGDGFKTIAAPDPDVFVDRPNLNDSGTVAFHRFFNDEPGEELVSGKGGPLKTIADTKGPFQSFGHFFGFNPPALNNDGDVAFLADLDSARRGIYVGPDLVGDRVIETGETLDGLTITDLRFCDEGLNDSGQLAFQATFVDPSVPDGRRVGVYRATPAAEELCGNRSPTLVGTDDHDVLVGTQADDVIAGLGGNDGIDGRGGDDVICGGPGADLIEGGDGDDKILGDSGNDQLFGQAGADILIADGGNDVLGGGPNNDSLRGGDGDDALNGSDGFDKCEGDQGAGDTAVNCERTTGVP